MSVFLRSLLPAVVAAVVLVASVGPAPAAAGQAPSSAEARLLSLINNARAGAGRVALRWDRRLGDVAQTRSNEMARTGNFAHLTSSQLSVLFDAEGITWYRRGEALVKTPPSTVGESINSALNSWRGSSAHWSLLMNTDFNYIALGMARATNGWYYWTAQLIKGPDRTKPVAAMSGSRLGAASGGKRSVTVAWTGHDVRLSVLTAGLRNFRLQRRIGSGRWVTVVKATTATSGAFDLAVGKTYRFRVKARDWAGNRGTWSPVLIVKP